jgi:hypothetical protein
VVQPLSAALNLLLLTLGLAAVTFVLRVSEQVEAGCGAIWPASTWSWAPRAAPCS